MTFGGSVADVTEVTPRWSRRNYETTSSIRRSFRGRRLFSAMTVAASASAYLAVPVLTLPAAHVHPVSASYAEVPVHPVSAPGVVGEASSSGQHFDLVGATWRGGSFDQRST